jgi:hypothetical protein
MDRFSATGMQSAGANGSESQKIENATNYTKPPAYAQVKINPFMEFVEFVASFLKFCILNVSTNSGMTRTLNCTLSCLCIIQSAALFISCLLPTACR